jgi:hypothetical protein
VTATASDGQTRSASEWLVPVSRHLRFAQASGHTVQTSFSALQAAALDGRLGKVVCDVRGPMVEVAAGDQLWFSTDELDVGVFAVGRARRPTKAKRPTLTVSIDRARTRLLAADPLPVGTIRRWVPELRQGAVGLDLRPRALAVLDGWQAERGERDTELLTPLGVTPWRAASRAAGGSALATDEVLGPISRLLRSQEFAVGVLDSGDRPAPWLVARRVRDVVVIDVERIKSGRGRDQALAAIGPLRELRWKLEREPKGELRVRTRLWIAFAGKPSEEVTTFLEDEDVLVSWLRAGTVELTDRSKQRWYQYLGVR